MKVGLQVPKGIASGHLHLVAESEEDQKLLSTLKDLCPANEAYTLEGFPDGRLHMTVRIDLKNVAGGDILINIPPH